MQSPQPSSECDTKMYYKSPNIDFANYIIRNNVYTGNFKFTMRFLSEEMDKFLIRFNLFRKQKSHFFTYPVSILICPFVGELGSEL